MGFRSRLVLHACLVLAAASLIAPPTSGQAYPTKPVRLIVGNLVGSGMDTAARAIAQKLGENLGVQIVVDNRPGAAGIIAAELLAKATPDGYTIMIVNPSHATARHLRKLPYDTLRDFAPVALLATSANILAANATLPANTVSQLIAAAKPKPQDITIGTLPHGGFNNLCAVLFETMAGIRLLHVQYKGAPAAVTDLIAGQIALTFSGIPPVLPFIRTGKLKGLGVTTMKRSSVVPEVPTLHEAGVPGYEAALWFGIVAPANIQRRVAHTLYSEIANAVSTLDVRSALLNQGMEPNVLGPAEFGAYIKAEMDKWGKVLRTTM